MHLEHELEDFWPLVVVEELLLYRMKCPVPDARREIV
jgi:hypothetical protein